MGDTSSSPAKRKVVDAGVDEQEGVSLAALQAELRANQEATISTIRGDLQQAVGGVQREMVERIATVETEVTKQLKTTLQLLQELTMKQDKHKEGLDKLGEGQHALEDKVGTISEQYKDLAERVEKLESKGFQGGLSVQSTTTTEPDNLGGKRAPALIVVRYDHAPLFLHPAQRSFVFYLGYTLRFQHFNNFFIILTSDPQPFLAKKPNKKSIIL